MFHNIPLPRFQRVWSLFFVGKDLFGAEPFDPFTCGAADFPPDIQSKLDEMQVSPRPSGQFCLNRGGRLSEPRTANTAVCYCQSYHFEDSDMLLSHNEHWFFVDRGRSLSSGRLRWIVSRQNGHNWPISSGPHDVTINQADVGGWVQTNYIFLSEET